MAGNIYVKIHFQHPDQEYGWSERYYLLGQTDLPGAQAVGQKVLDARVQLCAVDVTLHHAYVTDDSVFRDRLYLQNPGYTYIAAKSGTTMGQLGTNLQFAFNPDLVPDGKAAEPEVAALVRLYNREGTQHGRVFLRGVPDKYFLTDPDAYFNPTGTWQAAFTKFKLAIGAAGDNAGAKVGFKVVDKTLPRFPITGMTYAGGLLTIQFVDPPGPPAGGLGMIPTGGIRIGRAEGVGLRVNKRWKYDAVALPNAQTITIKLPAPGFTWQKGGYVQGVGSLIAPAANCFWIREYYTEHQTGRGITGHKGRQRKRTPDITF